MGNRKLPFGYKMVMGEIVVHPQEAQAVQGIYARYLAGASFNDITDHLKEKGPPYDADKPWNKNMVARILEDNRYTGTDRFPAILDADQMKETTSLKFFSTGYRLLRNVTVLILLSMLHPLSRQLIIAL